MQEANPISYQHKFFEKFARRHLLPISFFLLMQNLKRLTTTEATP